ncbi:hypothetical protein EDD64_102114 [Effusibacillus lacus]|nr:hypothetical protein EDD64_102114 [Effusibacillus lacus]
MSGLDRWVWVVKVIGILFSTCTAILSFRQRVAEMYRKTRRKKQKSPHRSAR